ncbi:hypothetical protein [Herbidospora cretacea]|uniref:hypothetical protein n=1 Tax=Herbidospora cretacea TaxID=28444 RepID=UPI0012F9053A|nr:hypothetical protein [Herbidospora cretacea]
MRRTLMVSLLLVAGCASPAWTDSGYHQQVVTTAEAAASSVDLVRLVVENEARLTRPYLQTVLTEAVTALGSVDSQFSAVQPPTRAAVSARAELTALTGEAADQVQTLLNEVRLGGVENPAQAAGDLRELSDELRAAAE